jgi:hypothetical protein
MESLTRTDTGVPIGLLASYSVRASATPFNPVDSSGEIPSFNATITDAGFDVKKLIGSYVTLRDWTGFRFFTEPTGQVSNGRVTAVRKSASSGAATLDASSIFERLNTEQTTLPILQADTLDYPVSEAINHWLLMCGVTPYNIEGNLHTYLSKYSNIGYLGQSSYKWRYFGPPTNYKDYVTTETALGGDAPRLEVNPSQTLTLGIRVPWDLTLSEYRINGYLPHLYSDVIYTLRRVDNNWSLMEKIGTAAATTLKTWSFAPANSSDVFFMAQLSANAADDKADITFRALQYDYVNQNSVITDSTTVGVTTTFRNRPIPRRMQLGWDSALTTGRVYNSPDIAFITEDATLQSVYPQPQTWVQPYLITPPSAADIAKMPDFIPGFTGNVWDKLRELCAILDLDIEYVNGRLAVRAREAKRLQTNGTYIPARRLYKNSLTEQIQDRETARTVEVNYYERQPKADNMHVMYKADSVYTLEKGETKVEKIQTNNSFIYLNQPIPVAGVPVPYTSPFGSYVITGADGYIVDPVWWRDNGGSITVKTTNVSGEIEITMQAPTIDTVRAPYRVSEGVADRPALYIVGYGLAFKEPETMTIYTGNSRAAQEVGATLDSQFVTKKLIGMNAGHRLAEVYGSGEATISFNVSRSDEEDLGDSAMNPTALGDAVYWSGSYYRIVNQTVTPAGVQYSDCHTFNTIATLNGEFAEGSTIADWNALHTGETIADTNVAPLPTYES